jgi:hypothetical protein
VGAAIVVANNIDQKWQRLLIGRAPKPVGMVRGDRQAAFAKRQASFDFQKLPIGVAPAVRQAEVAHTTGKKRKP